MKGKIFSCLCEGKGKNDNELIARTDGNITIEFVGDEENIGKFCNIKVTDTLTWIVKGEIIKEN